MPEEPMVCPHCGAPVEARAGSTEPLCSKCAEQIGSKRPPRSRRGEWWLLACVAGPGVINLLLTSLQNSPQEVNPLVAIVTAAGPVVGAVAAVKVITPRIQGPLAKKILGGLAVGLSFALVTFMGAVFGCTYSMSNPFHSR